MKLLAALTLVLAGLAPAQEILPLLKQKCAECHDGKLSTSGFSVASVEKVIAGGSKHGKAVIGGHPAESVLMRFIRGEMTPRMPVGGALTPAEIATVAKWIESLPAERLVSATTWRWPYEKPAMHNPPPVKNAVWAKNLIDRFVLAKLEAKQIPPAPEPGKRTAGPPRVLRPGRVAPHAR